MYAEMERLGTNLNEIDTTDCENSLESLQVKKFCGIFEYSCKQGFGSGSAWIRINLSCWIRIRIRIQIADPDPGGQKWPTKIEKIPEFPCVLSTGCSLLRAEGYSCSLGILYGGLGISKLQFLIKKIEN